MPSIYDFRIRRDSAEKQGQRLLTQSVVQLQFPPGAMSVAGS
jgi:hypothetical protein